MSSSSRYFASRPLSCSAATTRLTQFFSWNWRAETLTLTLIGASPASCHALFCLQAARSAQSPIWPMSPDCSAIANELIGRHDAEARMEPADQGFHREDAPGAQIDLRLEEKEEFVARDRVAQFLLQRKFLVDPDVELGRIELEIVVADLLGAIHRGVGVGE